MTADNDGLISIDLTDVERELMVLVLNEYGLSAQVAVELLPPLIGKLSNKQWWDYIVPLKESIKRREPLSNLDWARALCLTEFGFGSDMVANARRFGPAADEYWVLELRSLQGKVSNQQRYRLLRDNATFPAPNSARNGEVCAVANTTDRIDLDDDERRLMTLTLNEYAKSPRHAFELLAPFVGQATYDNWATYVADLHQAVTNEQSLSDLDWARALFLTEIGFTSDLVGFARQFRGADEHGIVVLRSLQVTINRDGRYLLFSENATYPWIRRD
ncbi:MAG: hypothetical protein ACRDU5_16070 [Mycobacterium sp.]